MNRCLLVLACFTAGICPYSVGWAKGAGTLGIAVPAGQLVSLEQIEHKGWDELLRKYCDSRGYVDYQGWHKSKQDQQSLDGYLSELSRGDPDRAGSSTAKLAYWINAYNAVTIKGILREYPTTSIRNHTAKLFGYNIWDDLLLHVGDRTYSLNQMEHDVLRKMGEPRIHFAIVCASIGCPPLLNRAYSAEDLQTQLAQNTKRFFADKEKLRYQAERGTVALSPIMKWFAEDFGADLSEQLRFLVPYLPDEATRRLAASGRAKVSYLSYDWSLNSQKTE